MTKTQIELLIDYHEEAMHLYSRLAYGAKNDEETATAVSVASGHGSCQIILRGLLSNMEEINEEERGKKDE